MKDVVFPLTVQFEDVDSYQIVHHTRLVAYLERARVNFLVQNGVAVTRGTWQIVLYSLTVQFKKPARFLDNLVVTAALAAVQPFKIIMAYRIVRDTELLVKAETDIAFVDSVTKEIIPVPEEFKL